MTSAVVENFLREEKFPTSVAGRLDIGDIVGNWRIAAYLGCGLSAQVYRVTNVVYGYEGALKLLIDGSRGLKERFLAEADALRFLALKCLPRYMDAGVFEGAPYYVMEYLRPLPEPMPRRAVANFMNKTAKAVQTLHEAGFIHRDLKPGNILCRANGEPVLIDLGLIKRRGSHVSDPIVRHGVRLSIIDGKPVGVGTLDFAAPEQLLKGAFSVQSDIFSLGKVMRTLYEGRVPTTLKGVLRRATREDPADRYTSANEFAAAIRHRFVPSVTKIVFASAIAAAIWIISGFIPGDKAKIDNGFLKKPDETDQVYYTRVLPAAEAGNAMAQLCVADAHFYGRGVPTNRVEAVRWYMLAANQGEAAAQASLGLCLFRGWGCERDLDAAIDWYTRASEQGDLAAMNDLAFAYLHGIGVRKDEKTGFELAMKAAQRGCAPAQTMVGECYIHGIGVEADLSRGEAWLYRAARLGNRRAMRILEAN